MTHPVTSATQIEYSRLLPHQLSLVDIDESVHCSTPTCMKVMRSHDLALCAAEPKAIDYVPYHNLSTPTQDMSPGHD